VAVDIRKTLALLAKTQEQTQDPKTKEALASILTDLRSYLQEQVDEHNKLIESLNQSEAALADLKGRIAELEQQNAAQAKQIADLKKQLDAVGTGPSTNAATPLGLATSFKQVIDTIQAEARGAPGVATTIKSMDIELRGLVQVRADNTTVMVLPAEKSGIDPNSLSTLRVTFGAVPVAVWPAASPAPSAPATPPAKPIVKPPVAPVVGKPVKPRRRRTTK
jgi:hypothetical protein